MRRTLILGLVCAGLVWAGLADRALAQRDATAKVLGDPYYFYAAKTYGNHAADHVHILRQFISTGSPVAIDLVRQHGAEVRGNVTSAGWAYSQLSPVVKDHPDGGLQLTELEEQYAQVLEICDRLDAASGDAEVNPAVVSRILDALQSSLSGARATHQELALQFGDER